MSNLFLDLSIAAIEQALAIRKEIEDLELSLINLYAGGMKASTASVAASPAAVKPAKTTKAKRFVSVEARAKMAAAQKTRWAKKTGAVAVEPAVKGAKKKKRTMSPEGRARIAAAQKARWAKKAGAPVAVKAVVGGAKKKRTMSPEGRARIAAAQKARWAKAKKA